MSTENQEATAQDQAQESALDPGYIEIRTGSTKHPDAAASEDGRVEAVTTLYVGDSLEEAIAKYGEQFVHDQFIRSVTVTMQGKVRRDLDNGVPVSKVEEIYDDADPTETRSSVKDPVSSAMSAFNKMTDEEKREFAAMFDN